MNYFKTILTSVVCSFAMTSMAQKYVGGDISLLPTYEEHGANYMTEDGTSIKDMLGFFAEQGWNAMRVRLFVDPSKASAAHKGQGVRQDLEYVTQLGKRLKAYGFKFMLDFHYSDTWTDPGQHSTPSAWNSTDPEKLSDYLYHYTIDCLNTLKAAGAMPDFIQPGNEITYGMLWPTGHCYPDGGSYSGGTFDNFAKYLQSGIKACREVCPEAKIVIQTELSKEQNVTNFYKTLSKYTNDYDVIGISYYPYFHGPLATLEKVLKTLEETYPDKKIEIVETGYYHKWYPNNATYNLKTTWPDTNEGQRKFTADLIEMLNKHQSVDGLYWWFPEANEYGLDWSTKRVTDDWYNASLWDNETGRALPAIKELKNFRSNDSAIKEVRDERQESGSEKQDGIIYDLQGRKVADNTSLSSLRQGIYIYNGKKIKK